MLVNKKFGFPLTSTDFYIFFEWKSMGTQKVCLPTFFKIFHRRKFGFTLISATYLILCSTEQGTFGFPIDFHYMDKNAAEANGNPNCLVNIISNIFYVPQKTETSSRWTKMHWNCLVTLKIYFCIL